MASPSQALVLRFGTDLEPARRNIAAFAGQAGVALAAISANAVSSAKNLKTVGDAASTAGSGLMTIGKGFAAYKLTMGAVSIGIAAFTAVTALATQQLAELNKIIDEAKKSGASTDFFQVWSAQAASLGVSLKDMQAALTSAAAATKSSMSESGDRVASTIERIAVNVASLKNVGSLEIIKLRDADTVDERIKATIELIRQMYRTAATSGDSGLKQWADQLTQTAFPQISDQLSKAIGNGSINMDQLITKFRDAGMIFSGDLVGQAESLNRRLDEAKQHMANELQPVMEALARSGLGWQQSWVSAIEWIDRMITKAEYLRKTMANIRWPGGGAIFKSADEIAEANRTAAAGAYERTPEAGKDKTAKDLLRSAMNDPTLYTGPGESKRLAGAPASRVDFGNGRVTGNQAWNQFLQSGMASQLDGAFGSDSSYARPESGGGSSAGASSIDQVERYLDQLQKSVAVLKAEAAAYGESNTVKAQSIALARANEAARQRGTELTENEINETRRLAAEQVELNRVLALRQQATQNAADQAKFVNETLGSAFEKLIIDGEKFSDVVDGITKALMRAALQGALMGTGPLAGLFGTQAAPGATGAGSAGGLIGMLGGGLGSLFGGGAAPGIAPGLGGLYHSGGFVGKPSASRMVDPAIWAGAPRFHSGGVVGGEVPIIAKAGELVLNAAQQANLARGMGGGGMNVVIENHGADVQTKQEQGSNGMPQLKVLVRQMMIEDVAKNGPFAQTLQNTYGNQRTRGRG